MNERRIPVYAGAGSDPCREFEVREMLDGLRDAVGPAGFLLLCLVADGMKQKEIAELMGCSTTKVSNLLSCATDRAEGFFRGSFV